MTSPGTPRSDSFVPIPVGDIELSITSSTVEPNQYGQGCALVRIHGVPLGTLSLLEPVAEARDLRALALARFGTELATHLQGDGATLDQLESLDSPSCTPAPSAVLVSVVVCTLGRDPRLSETVTSILDQSHSTLELIVVDNDPSSGLVRTMLGGVQDTRMRVVEQAQRGLSAARNAGVSAARGDIIAFTDDDAFADPQWLAHVITPFTHPEVKCVTGLVVPAELATLAQSWFEEFGAFDKGFEALVWSARQLSLAVASLGRAGEKGALFPYSAGVFGSGNNMAFSADWLRSSPLFDEALGAGTLTRGGEDLDAFLHVMLSGGVLVYEPRAIVRHYARAEFGALRSQMYGYGSGMSAVVAKHALGSLGALGQIATRMPAGLRKLLSPASEKNVSRSPQFPSELARAELVGYAAGPWLYLRAQAALWRLRRRAGRS